MSRCEDTYTLSSFLYRLVVQYIIFIYNFFISIYFTKGAKIVDITKIAKYKSDIYGNEEIEKCAISGSVTGLFKAFAPKIGQLGAKVVDKGVSAYNSFAKAGVGRKALTGAGVGSAVGAVKGAGNYNQSQDDGSFGASRIGQTAKGALGGALTGAATGAALGTITKGLKPINRVSTPAQPVSKPMGLAPGAARTMPKIDPVTGHVVLDPSQYKVSNYIDELYMEKIASMESEA